MGPAGGLYRSSPQVRVVGQQSWAAAGIVAVRPGCKVVPLTRVGLHDGLNALTCASSGISTRWTSSLAAVAESSPLIHAATAERMLCWCVQN